MSTVAADVRSPRPTSRQDARTRTIDELEAAICGLARRMNADTSRFLVLVREFDDRFGWRRWSFNSCAEWLAWRCELSLSAAREKVRTAHALRRLPAISKAFAEGRLSYSKVRALTRVAQARDEDLLLEYALGNTAAQVEERCRQMRNVAPESVDDARRARARRSLSVWRRPERGTLVFTVELPAEDGEVVVKALERAVQAGDVPQGPDLGAGGWRAQQADAFLAVAKSYLARGARESRVSCTADHHLVVVHVDESALRGGAGRADLPRSTIERLACDGSIVWVVDDERGRPVGVGRKRRTVSAALRRALWARDRGCRFPGCHNRRFVDAHHLEHWARGGETALDNLALLCTHHHALVHEGVIAMHKDEDGELRFVRKDGREIPRSGYCIDDVLPDPLLRGGASAEAWLAAVVQGRKPSAEARADASAEGSSEPASI